MQRGDSQVNQWDLEVDENLKLLFFENSKTKP